MNDNKKENPFSEFTVNQRKKTHRSCDHKFSTIFGRCFVIIKGSFGRAQNWPKMNNKIYINFETKSLKIKSLVSMSNYSF